MPSFKDRFMSLPVAQRREIAERAGMTIGYLNKHMYVSNGEPKFTMQNAVNLDAASNGALPFWENTEGDVDWDYVRRRLTTAHRNGEL